MLLLLLVIASNFCEVDGWGRRRRRRLPPAKPLVPVCVCPNGSPLGSFDHNSVKIRQNGYCSGDGDSWGVIKSHVECQIAAGVVSWADYSATDLESSSYPVGCLYQGGSSLYYNRGDSLTACSSSNKCLCAKSPLCTTNNAHICVSCNEGLHLTNGKKCTGCNEEYFFNGNSCVKCTAPCNTGFRETHACTATKDRQCAKNTCQCSHGNAATKNDNVFIIVAGGKDATRKSPVSTVQEFNGSTWKTLTNMHTLRYNFGLAYFKNKIYALGGLTSGRDRIKSVESFDGISLAWDTDASMSVERASFGVAVLNDKMYAIGGEGSGGVVLRSVESFDGRKWKQEPKMLQQRHMHSVCIFQNKIYVAGGTSAVDASNTVNRLSSAEYFDGSSWRNIAPMSSARVSHSMVVLGDKLYGIGGFVDGWTTASNLDVYDFTANAWSLLTNSTSKMGGKSVAFQNRIYTMGGSVLDSNANDVDTFDGLRWAKAVPMKAPMHYGFATTVAAKGCVRHDNNHCVSCHTDYYVKRHSSIWKSCERCISACPVGYHETQACTSSTNRVCTQNICTCAHGTAVVGTDCTTHGAHYCSACVNDNYFKTGNRCQACADACGPGYHQPSACSATADRVCKVNQCTCNHGDAATGAACTEHGKQICSSCLPTYFKRNFLCFACNVCTAGQYEDQPCGLATQRSCQECQPGQFAKEALGAVGQCSKCSIGKFSSLVGRRTDCDNCKIGKSTRTSGAATCSFLVPVLPFDVTVVSKSIVGPEMASVRLKGRIPRRENYETMLFTNTSHALIRMYHLFSGETPHLLAGTADLVKMSSANVGDEVLAQKTIWTPAPPVKNSAVNNNATKNVWSNWTFDVNITMNNRYLGNLPFRIDISACAADLKSNICSRPKSIDTLRNYDVSTPTKPTVNQIAGSYDLQLSTNSSHYKGSRVPVLSGGIIEIWQKSSLHSAKKLIHNLTEVGGFLVEQTTVLHAGLFSLPVMYQFQIIMIYGGVRSKPSEWSNWRSVSAQALVPSFEDYLFQTNLFQTTASAIAVQPILFPWTGTSLTLNFEWFPYVDCGENSFDSDDVRSGQVDIVEHVLPRVTSVEALDKCKKGGIHVRYICLERHEAKTEVSLMEIKAFNAGGEIKIESGEMSSTFNGMSVEQCFDGDVNTMCHAANPLWHISLDLGRLKCVESIEITNRNDGHAHRILGGKVSGKRSKNGPDVWSKTIRIEKFVYVFKPKENFVEVLGNVILIPKDLDHVDAYKGTVSRRLEPTTSYKIRVWLSGSIDGTTQKGGASVVGVDENIDSYTRTTMILTKRSVSSSLGNDTKCAVPSSNFPCQNIDTAFSLFPYKGFEFFLMDDDGAYTVSSSSLVFTSPGMALLQNQSNENPFVNIQCAFDPCIDLKVGEATIKGIAFNRSTSSRRSSVVRGVVGIDFATPVLIQDCKFTGFDQAISLLKLIGHITILRVSFTRNVAPALAHGGAVSVDSCNNLELDSCTFSNNMAELGGAISVKSTFWPAKITVKSIRTVENSATNGGAIYVGKMSYIDMADCSMFQDSATEGGAMLALTSASATLSHIKITRGLGSHAILCTGSDIKFLHSLLSDSHNGGLAGEFCFSEIRNSTFSNLGGAMKFVSKSDVKITNSFFLNNTATTLQPDGGGLLMRDGKRLDIESTLFLGNTAKRGGAVALFNSKQVVLSETVYFGENVATHGGGGGLLWSGIRPAFSFKNSSSFDQNVALYGNSFASTTTAIRVSSPSSLNIPSSNIKPLQPIQLRVMDYYSSSSPDKMVELVVNVQTLDSNAPVLGVTRGLVSQSTGTVTFKNLIVAAKPGIVHLRFSLNIDATIYTELVINAIPCEGGLELKELKPAGYRCEHCESGRFKETKARAMTSCTVCPSGYFSEKGATQCASCGPTEMSGIGATTCFDAGENVHGPALTNLTLLHPTFVYNNESNRSMRLLHAKWVVPNELNLLDHHMIIEVSHNPDFQSLAHDVTHQVLLGSSVIEFETQKLLYNQVFYIRVALKHHNERQRGPWISKLIPWLVTSDCDEDEYLNETHESLNEWKCTSCPVGGICVGNVRHQGIRGQFGFWRVPGPKPQLFRKCLFPGACLGGVNLDQVNKYYNGTMDKHHDLARKDNKEVCNEIWGHAQMCKNRDPHSLQKRKRCRLCATCLPGYKRSGRVRCKICPSTANNRALLVLGIIACVCGAAILIALTIQAEGATISVSEATKKIALNYLQVVSLAALFPMQWPSELEGFFEFQSAISSASQALLSPDCELSWMTPAVAFYQKQLMFACLPLSIVAVCKIVWAGFRILQYDCGYQQTNNLEESIVDTDSKVPPRRRIQGRLSKSRRMQTKIQTQKQRLLSPPKRRIQGRLSKSKSERIQKQKQKQQQQQLPPADFYFDRQILSIVVLLYLTYPTSAKQALSPLACERVGAYWWLAADLEEKCFVGRHLYYVILVCIPQIICYVIGMPVLAMIILRKNKDKLTTPQCQFRWGLLYSGYREKVYWWEITVVIRKVALVIVGGVFGSRLGPDMQVYLALALVMIFIVVHLAASPFDQITAHHNILHWLELCSLVICWATLYSGMLFWVAGTQGRIDHGFLIFVSISIIAGNVLFTAWLIFVFIKSTIMESREKTMIKKKTKNADNASNESVDLEGVISKIKRLHNKRKRLNGRQRKIVPRKHTELRRKKTMERIERKIERIKAQKSIRTRTVENIENNHKNHRALAIQNIRTRQKNRRASVVQRLDARKKAKQQAKDDLERDQHHEDKLTAPEEIKSRNLPAMLEKSGAISNVYVKSVQRSLSQVGKEKN